MPFEIAYCFNTSPSVFLVLIHAILTHVNTSSLALLALNKAIPPKNLSGPPHSFIPNIPLSTSITSALSIALIGFLYSLPSTSLKRLLENIGVHRIYGIPNAK
jgi:hypothetical protein